MGRTSLLIIAQLAALGCDSSKVQEATTKAEYELPTYDLSKSEGTRYIYFAESGATATTSPGQILAASAYGVMVYNSDDTAILPDGVEWGVNFYRDEIARIEPRDAVVLRAYAGTTGDWAGLLVASRSRVFAELNPESEAKKIEAEEAEKLRATLAGVPGADKLKMGEIARARITRWAIATQPQLTDFGLTENPGLRVVFVAPDCKACEVWRKKAEEEAYLQVVEVEKDDLKYSNLFKLVGQKAVVPAMLEPGKITVLPTP